MKKKNKTCTLKDVALKSGVATSTVSRVFDPIEKNKISLRIRKKVERIAKKMDYVANRSARALSRGGSTETIGLIFPNSPYFSASEYFSTVIMNATAAFRDYNYDLKVHMLRKGEDVESLFALKQHLNVDGLIMTGIQLSKKFDAENSNDVPIVMIDSGARIGIATICPDNEYGGFLAAEHFHNIGMKKVGMIIGAYDFPDIIERKKGFKKCLKANKIKINKDWFIDCEPGEVEGYNAGISVLKKKNHPTALFCSTDETALGVIRAAKELGLKCPKDVAIIGFDNLSISQYVTPALTTIEQPTAEISRAAVDLLIKIIKTSVQATHTVFPVKLIKRESA